MRFVEWANVVVGRDEIYLTQGDTSDIDAEIKALEESKKDIDYTQDEEVWMAEVEAIQAQIQTKLEEINNIPKTENDNTVYWEGYYYETKRTSYNGNIRKHFASKGMIYDPVRDAFYAEQPYPSWILNEETCIYGSRLHPNLKVSIIGKKKIQQNGWIMYIIILIIISLIRVGYGTQQQACGILQ